VIVWRNAFGPTFIREELGLHVAQLRVVGPEVIRREEIDAFQHSLRDLELHVACLGIQIRVGTGDAIGARIGDGRRVETAVLVLVVVDADIGDRAHLPGADATLVLLAIFDVKVDLGVHQRRPEERRRDEKVVLLEVVGVVIHRLQRASNAVGHLLVAVERPRDVEGSAQERVGSEGKLDRLRGSNRRATHEVVHHASEIAGALKQCGRTADDLDAVDVHRAGRVLAACRTLSAGC